MHLLTDSIQIPSMFGAATDGPANPGAPWPGAGPAADALRAADWAASPLGPPPAWPVELRTAVDMVFGAHFPMGVMWGPECIAFFNDGIASLLGPAGLAGMGRPARECLAQGWETLGPLAAEVMDTGHAVWLHDAELRLGRDGGVETGYFTFSYSPIRDARGSVAGIFVAAVETTAQVVERRRAAVVAAVLDGATGLHDGADAIAASVAAAAGHDLPWVAVYHAGEGGLALAAHAAASGVAIAPRPAPAAGALARALRTARVVEVPAHAVLGRGRGGAWEGLVVACRLGDGADGVLVAGVPPGQAVDAAYAAFVQRVGNGVHAALRRVTRAARAERERITVLERMTDGFFALDAEWRLQHVNPVAERLAGRGRGELEGRVLWDEFPRLAGSTFEHRLRAAMRSQEAAHFTARLPDGGPWLEMHAYPSPQGLTVFHRDVTDAVRMERARAELLERERLVRGAAEHAERRLRELVEGVDAIVWEAEGNPPRTTFVSDHARKMLGYAPERWTGEPDFWRGIIHPDDRDRVVRSWFEATRERRDQAIEYRMLAADGRVVWVRDLVRVSADAAGGVHVRGVVVDITAQRTSEHEARRLAAIVEGTEEVVISKTLDGTILSWNPGAERTFGWREAEVAGRSIFDLLPPEAHAHEREILARVAAGERVARVETERPGRDGRMVAVSITLSPIRDASGKVVAVASIGRDVTQERKLQAQLRQAQKMEAVGRLAGGIAHDFNNLLTAIKGNAGLLLAELPQGSPWREDVEEIDRAAQRASDLTRQLLAFSRRQVLQPRVVDLNAVIGETRRMLRRLIEEDVAIEVRLGTEPGWVRADPGQVEQVVLNLAVNARDAMPGGGTLAIGTGLARVPAEPREGWPYYVAAGDYVRLDVEDTGAGMEPGTMAHLFEPFFTTKPAGKGTGLGLSTVYGIVKQSGGYVWAESTPGQGSRFVVLLPRANEDEAAAVNAPRTLPGGGGGATVLLVEDEETVRSLTRRVLARGGYRVLEAADATQALQVARAHDGEIDLLLTDVVMPGGGGQRVAASVTQLRPGTRILFMSGYPGDAIAEHGLSPGVDLLPKPFSPETLLLRVADALKRKR